MQQLAALQQQVHQIAQQQVRQLAQQQQLINAIAPAQTGLLRAYPRVPQPGPQPGSGRRARPPPAQVRAPPPPRAPQAAQPQVRAPPPPMAPQQTAPIHATFGILGKRKRNRPQAPANGRLLEPTDTTPAAAAQFNANIRTYLGTARTHAALLALDDPVCLELVPNELRDGLQVIQCAECRNRGWKLHPPLDANGHWSKRYTSVRTQILRHICENDHLCAMRRRRQVIGPQADSERLQIATRNLMVNWGLIQGNRSQR